MYRNKKCYKSSTKTLEEITPNTSKVIYKSNIYFCKTARPSRNPIKRLFLCNDIPSGFKNEIDINLELSKVNFRFLNYPKLIDVEGRHIYFDFIVGKTLTHADFFVDENLVNAVYELNTCTEKLNRKKGLLRNIHRRNSFIVLSLLNKNLRRNGTKLTVKLVLLFLKLHLYQRKNDIDFLLHNDLHSNNIVFSDDKAFIIDFEDATFERKWFLFDIVNVSFDKVSMEYNIDAISKYIKLLKKHNILSDKSIIYALQMAFLRRSIKSLSSIETTTNQKKKILLFVKNFLTNKNYLYSLIESF